MSSVMLCSCNAEIGPATQIGLTADSLLEKRQRRTIPRWRLVLVGVLVAIVILAFVALRPSAPHGKFPSGFSDAEKREISSLFTLKLRPARALRHQARAEKLTLIRT